MERLPTPVDSIILAKEVQLLVRKITNNQADVGGMDPLSPCIAASEYASLCDDKLDLVIVLLIRQDQEIKNLKCEIESLTKKLEIKEPLS